MKKLSLLIALALILSIGGVYATWNYAQGDAVDVSAYLDRRTMITDAVVDATPKGTIAVDTSNFSLTIDDDNNDHVAELIKDGWIDITFTPSAGADAGVAANGIALQYVLSCTGGSFEYNGNHIFTYSSDPVILNDRNATKSVRIEAGDIDIALNGSISLPTVADYEAFKRALHSGSLIFTVSEYTA